MPAAVIDVDTDDYLSAGSRFLAVNGSVCDLVADAACAAGAGGGMAGTDSSGVEWSAGYDGAAASALSSGAVLADAVGHLGALLNASADNHAAADVSSAPGATGCWPGADSAPGAAGVLPAAPPSADGTGDDPPPGWFLVAHLLQYTWPNGHQDRLRSVAAGWRDAAAELDVCADRLSAPIGDISMLRSPEVDAAVTTCCDVQQSARELSTVYATLGLSCAHYADRLDEAHSDVIDALVEFATESAAIQVIAGVAAAATAGGSEVAGQAAQAARTAVTASRIGRILAKLVEFVRALSSTVRLVLTRITDVLARLRAVLAKGATKAVETLAPQMRSDWPQLSAALRAAARGKGMFGVGSFTRAQTEAMGQAWVGPGATLASDGKTWVSSDGLRQYRPPTWKPNEGRVQANLQRREVPRGNWTHNGHVDVTG